jgi:hypothetical protein
VPKRGDGTGSGQVHRCILCGASEIDIDREGRFERATCHACGGVFEVEWNPPDAPGLRGRIAIIRPSSADKPQQ